MKTQKLTQLQGFAKQVIKSYLKLYKIPQKYLLDKYDNPVNLKQLYQETAEKLKRDSFAALYFNTDDPCLYLKEAKTPQELPGCPKYQDELDSLSSTYTLEISGIIYKILVIEDI